MKDCPMPIDPITALDSSNLTIGSALGALGVAAYGFYRRIRNDNRDDNKNTKIDDWTNGLIERIKQLESKIDVYGKEKEAALTESAKLKALLENEKEKTSKLEKEVAELRSIVDELRAAKNATDQFMVSLQGIHSSMVAENNILREKLKLPTKSAEDWKPFVWKP